MNRDFMLNQIQNISEWDVVVIGGGATGTGIALDSASRGYNTLLLEKGDFASGTSSKSTKLVHGGVRYLQQGNIALVMEALRERGLLLKNAPHLVNKLSFVVPNYDWWEGPFYGIGLKIYDLLSGKEGFGRSVLLSKDETLEKIPTIEQKDLNGGVIYYDGQFDDARLVINIAQTAFEQGAALVNYMPVTNFKFNNGKISGLIANDLINDKEYEINSKIIINATGPFSDSVRKLDDINCNKLIQPSQGIHIVLDKSFLPGNSAIMLPNTDDGRVLFAIPWLGKIIIGTTDTSIESVEQNPIAREEEVDFLLEHAARYLTKNPSKEDVLSVFAGIRPLVSDTDKNSTSKISREHVISTSKSGLVSILGGKWTTYRKMAEDTLDEAIKNSSLEKHKSITKSLQIHGYNNHSSKYGHLSHYGSDAIKILELIRKTPKLGKKLHPNSNIVAAEVIWCARHEMVLDVESFLARRNRILFLDAKTAIELAPKVADILRKELKKSFFWKQDQIKKFNKIAEAFAIN